MSVPGVGAIVGIKRAIMSLLSQGGHCGPRSNGTALVHATGADVLLPNAAYAVPVVATSASGNVQTDRTRMVKVNAPTVLSGQKKQGLVVTAAGTSVPIMSMLGGLDKNLPAGTLVRWEPSIAGIEPTSLIDGPSGLTGGTSTTTIGQAKRIVAFEGITQDAAPGLWAASLGAFPAIVVAWQSSAEAAAMQLPQYQTVDHTFRLYVVCSRLDSQGDREDEGERILEDVSEILCDRGQADGEVFAASGAMLGSAGRLVLAPTSLIYWQDVVVRYAVRMRELRTFAPYLRSREQVLSATTTNDPPTIVEVDISQNMPST